WQAPSRKTARSEADRCKATANSASSRSEPGRADPELLISHTCVFRGQKVCAQSQIYSSTLNQLPFAQTKLGRVQEIAVRCSQSFTKWLNNHEARSLVHGIDLNYLH